jgi:hypothetical protein
MFEHAAKASAGRPRDLPVGDQPLALDLWYGIEAVDRYLPETDQRTFEAIAFVNRIEGFPEVVHLPHRVAQVRALGLGDVLEDGEG